MVERYVLELQPFDKILINLQGSHRLEKYLNIGSFLERPLKTKSALKSTGESLSCLEKSLNFTTFFLLDNTDNGDIDQYRIVVPLFGAAYAAPNESTSILY